MGETGAAPGVRCPGCGTIVETFRNPVPTADVIVEMPGGGIVLILRRDPPRGWALPGGFVDYGERLEACAVREAKEEIGLDVALVHALGTYSDPARDARRHTITTVFVARPLGDATLHPADDAADARVFSHDALPSPIVFDHAKILDDYFRWKASPRG
jgi:8-oxo-dGTP diphosphatase